MSKKKKKKQPPPPAPAAPSLAAPAFAVGAKVRVRRGVVDLDSDLPIGGWTGSVVEIDTSSTPFGYFVEWDQHTLDSMHPVFIKRCRRDDLEVESMWLDETDLEPDQGEMLPIEQPGEILTRPLDANNQEDRIRAVFGLTSDDPLPDVSDETLTRYHAYLAEHLRFPFEAALVAETGPLEYRERRVTVQRLLPPEETDAEDGLLCAVRFQDAEDEVPLGALEVVDSPEQKRLVGDYGYWLTNWGETGPTLLRFPEQGGRLPLAEELLASQPVSLGRILNKAGVVGAVYGATVGTIAAVLENARMGLAIGAGVMALLFGLAGRRYGVILGALRGLRQGPLVGMLLGVLAGGVLGVLLGALAVAYVGSISGSIIGVILAGAFARPGRQARAKFFWGVFGAIVGGVALAFYRDHGGNFRRALQGLVIGTIAGAVGAALLVLVAIVTLGVLMNRNRE